MAHNADGSNDNSCNNRLIFPVLESSDDSSVITGTSLTPLAPPASEGDTSTTLTTDGKEKALYCGWSWLRPVAIQQFCRPVFLLVSLCICSVTQSMLINAFIPVAISTLERRFRLTAVQLGVFVACYDAAILLVQLPVCYLGEKGHKGRWLAGGMLLIATGSLVCTIPHFISDVDHAQSNTTKVDICIPGVKKEYSPVGHDESLVVFLLLCLGQLLHGAGAAPLWTLGITYMDENVVRSSSSIYLGLFLGSAVLGPAIGYVIGGFFLRIPGDIGKINTESIKITYEDMRWYGAWWVGFFVSCFCALVGAFAMSLFPRRLPEKQIAFYAGEGEGSKASVDGSFTTVSGGAYVNSGFKGILAGFKILCQCKVWIFLICVDGIEALASIGLVAFFPKIIENFFALSTSSASLLTGITIVPAAFFGNVVSGWVLKRFKMGVCGMLKFSFCANIAAFFLGFSFFAHCSKPLMAGVTVPYGYVINDGVPNSFQVNLNHSCNENCRCNDEHFEPVCDKNRSIVYFSPCYAGCSNKRDILYENCFCIMESYENASQGLYAAPFLPLTTSGFCPSNCVMLPVFLVAFSFLVFSSFLGLMPVQEAELRTVPYELRTLAFGLRWIIVRIFATIPGPIVFGLFVDNSCMFWQSAKCSIYDNAQLSRFLIIGCLSLKSLVLLALFLARRVHMDSKTANPTVLNTTAPVDAQPNGAEEEDVSRSL